MSATNSPTGDESGWWMLTKAVLIVAALVAGVIVFMHQADACEARSGKFVKGAVWYECVAAAPGEGRGGR